MHSSFASNKVLVSKSYFSGFQQKLSSHFTQLSLIVDVACLNGQLEDSYFLDQKLSLSVEQRRLKKVALSLQLSGAPSAEELEEEINQNSCFLGITENLNVTATQSASPLNDPYVSHQDHLNSLNHSGTMSLQSQINQKVVVAIIDTGVHYSHSDLSGRMWTDSNGHHGYNFVSGNTNPDDDNGHGTHVAGILGAIENNESGGAGLTGDYIEIMAIKALDHNGSGTYQNVYNGINYAITHGADIINLSLQSVSNQRNVLIEDALTDAVNAGIVVVGATGNENEEISGQRLWAPAYIAPSLGGVISVASIDTETNALSSFSNYSNQYAEISAPGAENSSSFKGILSTLNSGGWGRMKGTSQATPMVASAAALLIGFLKSKGITYTPSGIENFIRSDGAVTSQGLTSYVSSGAILNLGFLANNLNDYITAAESNETDNEDNNIFDGDESTGNVCILN